MPTSPTGTESGAGFGEEPFEVGSARPGASRAVRARGVRARGFSLVELMVVMVLVALLMAVVGVSISRSIEGAEIRNASREIVAGLRHTRGQAVIKRNEQVFSVDADARTWTAAGREPVAIPEGLDITLETARSEMTGENAGGIRFYPDGASTGGSVELLADERSWRINVGWLTGEVSVEQEADDA